LCSINFFAKLDANLLQDEKLVSSAQTDVSNDLKHQRLQKQPSIIINGELREYQLEGVNWLVHLFNNGIRSG
jgi:SWI/SNF-related matrix-associated actin-dependent regulator of chromatin subfamily A member 5